MKILFCSYAFAPGVGGIETAGRLLADEFAVRGHEIRVLTETPGASNHSYPVIRQPRRAALAKHFRWADVVFHNNISLRCLWPLAMLRRPLAIAHHTWISRPDGSRGAAENLKRTLLRFASNIAVSSAIARELPVPCRVIPAPYDAATFFPGESVSRSRDLVFAGRLVSDKGADLLLDALGQLRARNFFPALTVAGDGPERARLEAQARRLDLNATFTGVQTAAELARTFSAHRVAVVPSRWNEPFGIVALEAIAGGCAVIGTCGGGLPEAIGPCGITVPNGDATALASAVFKLLNDPSQIERCRSAADAHLQKHRPATIAESYLSLFEQSRAREHASWRMMRTALK